MTAFDISWIVVDGCASRIRRTKGLFPELIVWSGILVIAMQADGIKRSIIFRGETVHFCFLLGFLLFFGAWFKRKMLKEAHRDWFVIWIGITEENVIIVSIVTANNIGISSNGCLMREVVRRHAPTVRINNDAPGKKIMYECAAL